MKKIRLLCLMLSLMLFSSCFTFTVSAEVIDEYDVTGNFTWDARLLEKIMTATQEDGEYTFVIDTAKWTEIWNKAFVQSPYYYCYFDENGNVVDKATGDANPDRYTKHECGNGDILKRPFLRMAFDESAILEGAGTEPLVISYDYWYDNAFTDAYNRVAGDDTFMSNIYFTDESNKQLSGLNVTVSSNTQYIKGRTSTADTSYVLVDGAPAANQWNTMQIVLKPDLSGVLGTVVNGVYTESNLTLSGATSINKMVLNIGRALTNKDADGKYLPSTYKLRNIKLQRGLPDLAVVGGTENGTVTDRINVEFSGVISKDIDVSKAFVVIDDIGDVLPTTAYSVEWNEERTVATIILNEYDYDCDFKLIVVADELKGFLGETVTGELEIQFVTPFGESDDEEDDEEEEIISTTNLADGKSFISDGGIGKTFTEITDETTDGERIITFEFDNAAWGQYIDDNPSLAEFSKGGYYTMKIGEETSDDRYLRIAFDIKTTDPNLPLNTLPTLHFQTPGNGRLTVTQFNRIDHYYTSASIGQFNSSLDTEWHSLEIIFDTKLQSNGKGTLSLVRYDGETFYAYLTAGTKIQTHDAFSEDSPCALDSIYLQTYVSPNCDKSSISFRNPVVEKIDRLAFAVDNPDEPVNPEEDIKFEFNNPFPEKLTKADVKIYEEKDGELAGIPQGFEVAFDETTKRSFTISVKNGGLEYGKTYVAEILKENVVYDEYNVFEEKQTSFKTVENKDNIVETVRRVSKDADGTVTLNINIKNNTDKLITGAYMMVACYGENNKMLGVAGKELEDIAVGKSLKNAIVTIPGCRDAVEMKVFVFESTETFGLFHTPISVNIE